MTNQIITDLFKTNAVRVAPADQPFWYTSGKLGPFYINTHFLLHDEEIANGVLAHIERCIAEDKITAPKEIFGVLYGLYHVSPSYKNVIDSIVETAKKYKFDIVSGGERRDFIFSMVPAYILGKAHLTIYKDSTAVYSTSDYHETLNASEVILKGKTSLHIADLITEASSYERAWVPVLKVQEVEITDTIAVVDRHQGGEAVLKGLGIKMDTLAGIDKDLFDQALSEGIIDNAQYDLVMGFLADPDKYMRDFIAAHPTFIDDQIAMGGKNKERAELARSKGFC
ncbi:Orotate phosphoribosyltransferase [Ruminococcaceae bacterium YRB3002]|nr:Orotate phosphoribosyltransferase [Ruminococcaceae bacterium YRB3002]